MGTRPTSLRPHLSRWLRTAPEPLLLPPSVLILFMKHFFLNPHYPQDNKLLLSAEWVSSPLALDTALDTSPR